ncbi:MAG TPA: AAA family ATPase, partial [Streptosporangiaceae bacterium]|nr:AAA family ATPase [Streptosporangiaceae bacterium]
MTLPRVMLITGTGTGVGKTVVTAAVAARARAAGRSVAVVKPVQTGGSGEEPTDVAEVCRLGAPAAALELVRLPEPLAPQAAARRAGVPLPPLSGHARRIVDLAAEHDLVLVEGAGGLLV